MSTDDLQTFFLNKHLALTCRALTFSKKASEHVSYDAARRVRDLNYFKIYSRLSLSRNRRDPQNQFEISVLRHIRFVRFVVLRKKQSE